MKGQQLSYSTSNFYTTSQLNSYSFDAQKPKTCKSPTVPPKSIFSKVQNLQSLQQIKDQIVNLQNTLQNQSVQKQRLVQNQDKSFLNLIKDQLKQVNQLTDNKIQRRTSFQKDISKELSPKDQNSKHNFQMLKTLLNLQHRNVQPNENDENEVLKQKLESLNEKKRKLLKKLKRRYKEEKLKIIQFIDQQCQKEEAEFKSKMRLRMQEMLKNQNQKKIEKPINQWPNTMRASRSQSGRVKLSHQIIEQQPSSETSSSESIRKFLKQKKTPKGSDNDTGIFQLVSSLKKESPSLGRVSLEKKKKQKVRFKNQNLKEEMKNNITQPFSRFKTDDDDEDTFSDLDPKFSSLVNQYY